MAGPTREATVKLNLENGNYILSVRRAGDETEQAGKKATKATQAWSAGLAGAGRSVRGLLDVGSKLAGMAGGIAAAFSVGSTLTKAISVREQFRDIEFQINKTGKAAVTWGDLHAQASELAIKHGQNVEQMGESISSVFGATGDLEYTRAALDAIGAAAGAVGGENSMAGFSNAAQLLQRKFGATAATIDDMMATVVEKTGVGGLSLEDMTSKFGLLAGEAADAGMKGQKGLAQLLDVMIALDSRVGEKAVPGLKMLFQQLKDGSTTFKQFQKDSGVKIADGTDAFGKIRALVGTTKGRKALEEKLTGDVRVVYDELAKPFSEAFDAAKAIKETDAVATMKGLQAFDTAVAKLGKTTLTAEQMYKESIEGAKQDPHARLNAAIDKLANAFMQPAMMKAIDDLAEKLPKLADAFAKLLTVTIKHPLLAGGAVLGMSAVGGFFKGAAGAITVALVSQIKKSAISKAVGGALTSTVTGGAGGMGRGSGLKGLGSALAVGAAGFAGWELGKVGADLLMEGKESNQKAITNADIAIANPGDLATKKSALEAAKRNLADLNEGPGAADMVFGAGAQVAGLLGLLNKGDVAAATGSHGKDVAMAASRVAELEKQIKAMQDRAREKPRDEAAAKADEKPRKVIASTDPSERSDSARQIAQFMKRETLQVRIVGGGGSLVPGGTGDRGTPQTPPPGPGA